MKPEDQDSVYALLHMERPKDSTASIAKNEEPNNISARR
jgi:hypothetical protein